MTLYGKPEIVVDRNPGRTLGSSFQVSDSRNARVRYTLELVATTAAVTSLTADQDPSVELRVEDVDPPTSVADVAAQNITQLVGLSVGLSNNTRQTIQAHVPAGHYVLIANTGEGTPTIVSQEEVLL